ncbi:MAG: type 4a pilus biogenesis protein PilO [Gaiellaceae bacterium]
MKAQLQALSPRVQIALVAGAVLLYTLVVWFLVVSPKRGDAAKLSAEIAAAELRLVQAQATANRPQRGGVAVADVFRLAKAMPASADQPGLVLELDRLARSSEVTLGSITPKEPEVGDSGATMIEVAVVVSGSYRQITKFLASTRHLVTVRRGKLRATGRLLTVQNIELAESNSGGGFPLLDGTITFAAYVYDGPIAPPTPPPVTPTDGSTGATAQGATP